MNIEKLSLGQLISVKSNFEKLVDQKLLEFTCLFHNYMWDGYSEDVGQFVTDEDYEAIEALADKMKHMIVNIGCPSSVPGMLESIAKRKIKYWASHWSDDHGKQLKTKADRVRVIKNCNYEKIIRKQPVKNLMVDKGHFRWNRRAYTLSRRATDVLQVFLDLNL